MLTRPLVALWTAITFFSACQFLVRPRDRASILQEPVDASYFVALNAGNASLLCTSAALRADLTDSVVDRVRRGAQAARSLRVVFAGLAYRKRRGRFFSLELELIHFHSLGQKFADYRVILYESNSHRNTVDAVRLACKHPKLLCVLHGNLNSSKVDFGDKSSARLSSMAAMRNELLAKALALEGPFDLLVMADLDLHAVTSHFLPFRMRGGENNHSYTDLTLADGFVLYCIHPRTCSSLTSHFLCRWNSAAFLSAIGLQPEELSAGPDVRLQIAPRTAVRIEKRTMPHPLVFNWLGVCANGIVESTARHYDSFAFAPFEWGEEQRWAFRGDPIRVDSCFGGLALYNLHGIRASGCVYEGRQGLCEHAGLCRCLSRWADEVSFSSGRLTDSSLGIYLYPLMVNMLDRETEQICISPSSNSREKQPFI